MNPVKGQSSEHHFLTKIKGVFQDHNFFQSYHYVLTPNISLNYHSEVRGGNSSLRSNNSFITDTEKQRILVVDDDRDISNLYKLSLEHDGFIVHSFNDPLLALSSYKARAYDLLLLDINMPQMNGLVDDTKVCFISAFETYETEFKELFPDLNEADCFIRKPIELESLTKKVKSRLQSN